MATETEEAAPGSPWYTKFFEYWRNRNRVGPGKVELPDCDFVIVGPRRTLRVLKPALKSGWYYENTNDRPESIVDNFFTRWSRRPHSSGNCRCSFRQSKRLSTAEEQIITAELNRIRTSLCEAEKSERGIEELEQRVSVSLQKLQVAEADNDPLNTVERNVSPSRGDDHADKIDRRTDEQTIKSKIVKDLEKYINVLLEEILDDTVRYVAGADDTLIKDRRNVGGKSIDCSTTSQTPSVDRETSIEKTRAEAENDPRGNREPFNDLSFSFHPDKRDEREEESSTVCRNEEGYVNRGFLGTANDPDSLDFYLRPSIGTDVTMEQLDCIDSGINSVETIEFQPDQEPSLEQSLLRIIDEKLGRTPLLLRNSWEDLSEGHGDDGTGGHDNDNPCSRPTKGTDDPTIPRSGDQLSNDPATERSEVTGKNDTERNEPLESSVQPRMVVEVGARRNGQTEGGEERIDISTDNLANETRPAVDTKQQQQQQQLDETVNEATFEKLRLEFKDNESSFGQKKANAVSKMREKLCTNASESDESLEKCSWNEKMGHFELRTEATSIELEDYRKTWPNVDDKDSSVSYEQNPRDLVMYRRNRKPMIVFLHGFGSSAEIFEHQLRYFSALGYPCIAPEMLGHGMSSAPGRSRDYHFNKLLKDLDTVLCHYAFRPGQKCVLVAHNYGCSFAAALACKYDSSIHQLVLISGGGPTPLAPPSTESAGHCCLRAILAPFLMCGLRRDILYSARGRQHPYCGPEPPEQWPSHMKYVLDGMVWPEGDYVFHRRICTPTLLIHGLRDNKVSLVQECQMERTMLKAFLEAIPTAGHTPMTDCPEQVNHMIHCFIDLWKNKKVVTVK